MNVRKRSISGRSCCSSRTRAIPSRLFNPDWNMRRYACLTEAMPLGRETPPPQAYRIEPTQAGTITRRVAEGWNILGHHRARPDECRLSNLDELVDPDHPTNDGEVLYRHMASQLCRIPQHIPVPNDTVMGYVRVVHQEIAISHPRHHPTTLGAEWSVVNSRIVLPLPIISRLSSPWYFRSCGTAPIEEN